MAEAEGTDFSTLHNVLGAVSDFLDQQSIPYRQDWAARLECFVACQKLLEE